MKKIILPFVLLVLVLSSCTNRLTDFTVISTKNISLSDNDVRLEKVNNMRVTGKDVGHMIIYIPVSMPNLKEAVDKAIQSYPGCVGLADGVVKHNGWWAILYGQNKYIVEGTPLIERKVELSKPVAQQQFIQTQPTTVVEPQSITPTEAGMLFIHEVKANETVASIAQMYEVSVADIIKLNKLQSSKIAVGTKLKIIVK